MDFHRNKIGAAGQGPMKKLAPREAGVSPIERRGQQPASSKAENVDSRDQHFRLGDWLNQEPTTLRGLIAQSLVLLALVTLGPAIGVLALVVLNAVMIVSIPAVLVWLAIDFVRTRLKERKAGRP